VGDLGEANTDITQVGCEGGGRGGVRWRERKGWSGSPSEGDGKKEGRKGYEMEGGAEVRGTDKKGGNERRGERVEKRGEGRELTIWSRLLR
jgi:hypothetical protein